MDSLSEAVPFSEAQVAWILQAFKAGIGAAIRPVMQDILALQRWTPATEVASLEASGNEPSQSVNATVAANVADTQETISSRAKHNRARNQRRMRCRAKASLQREELLQLRPAIDLQIKSEANISLQQRVSNLEVRTTMPGSTAPNTADEAADVGLDVKRRLHNLEVIVTSTAYCSTARDEWGPLLAGELDTTLPGDVDDNDGSPNCTFQESANASVLRAEAPAFEPSAGEQIKPSTRIGAYDPSIGAELDRLLDDITTEAAVARCLVDDLSPRQKDCTISNCLASEDPTFGIGSIDANFAGADAGSLYPIEVQIAESIQETLEFKELSGEPWTAVQDEAGFLTAARQFASLASMLPDWHLNDLGRALNYRYLALSGRVLSEPQQLLIHELLSAVAVEHETLRQAALFSLEIGHFN
jgi:hypothetical protein